jgi:predicted DCC family thiol-disulfide oxidoreductase YuxK
VSHSEESGGQLQVIFDGRCGLCNGLVRWLKRRDVYHRLRFIPSESAQGGALLAQHGRDADEASQTILVLREGGSAQQGVLVRSAAVLALLRESAPPWQAVAHVLRWIPLPLRDVGYRIVARVRYRIWGRNDACPIPVSRSAKRFL